MATLDFPSPPTPNGFSHVVAVAPGSRLIVTSGQVPIAADGSVPSGWADQTRLVFENLAEALKSAGAGWSDVVKLTFFVTDVDHLVTVRAVRDEFVDVARPPASSLVQVAGLFRPDLLIEVEALAAVAS
ncbi:putative endoribonuclease L-PSP [Actinoplanes missouriensis 431]|uniref:Putative endoribonuclease L-PSP n=1 Tax=Actinoplanes missouriensis (strain ATCC 14538 / DSM 43046 / CBS 188.64 / JCM 3121 / NBRC 102363 / NCIMB 12654 / NRRL B-3342 / UNCC 431) TaxID=512565 RepID=I0HBU8_ACTM4|nr:RidA family protein [Actinoplanes missouriensis]BAL90485.1 putative endoribonuclease L-PSP [Actinoplanes missouriensis 431]